MVRDEKFVDPFLRADDFKTTAPWGVVIAAVACIVAVFLALCVTRIEPPAERLMPDTEEHVIR